MKTTIMEKQMETTIMWTSDAEDLQGSNTTTTATATITGASCKLAATNQQGPGSYTCDHTAGLR